MELWTEYEGTVVDGAFPLKKLLRPEGRSAFFSTSNGKGDSTVIRLVASHFDEDEILARWCGVTALAHPNILGLDHYGQLELDDTKVVYAVMEPVDANLDEVLAGQRLTIAETRQLATSLASALNALHAHGFVHEHIEPANVFAVGDVVKLRSDCIREAPEGARGQEAKRGDVHDLAVVLLQALTQKSSLEEARHDLPVPAPFDLIIPRGISGAWGLAEILTAIEKSEATVAGQEATAASRQAAAMASYGAEPGNRAAPKSGPGAKNGATPGNQSALGNGAGAGSGTGIEVSKAKVNGIRNGGSAQESGLVGNGAGHETGHETGNEIGNGARAGSSFAETLAAAEKQQEFKPRITRFHAPGVEPAEGTMPMRKLVIGAGLALLLLLSFGLYFARGKGGTEVRNGQTNGAGKPGQNSGAATGVGTAGSQPVPVPITPERHAAGKPSPMGAVTTKGGGNAPQNGKLPAGAPGAQAGSPARSPATSLAPTPTTAPATDRVAPGGARSQWRVVAFTYNHEDQAQKKAETVAQKYPRLSPQVFTPTGHAPYLVTIGGPMGRDDALALARRAKGLGLPRDVYAQNYTAQN